MTLSKTSNSPVTPDAAVIVTPPDELDIASAPPLGAHVLDLLIRGERKLVLDFAGVKLIDSAGIGVLLSTDRRVRAAGGELVVANVSDKVRRVFELTGVGRSLHLRDDG
jgi:anti-anti-sigma factor